MAVIWSWSPLLWAQVSDHSFITNESYSTSPLTRTQLPIDGGWVSLVHVKASEPEVFARHKLNLQSTAALVLNQQDGRLLYAKRADAVKPIASITKLMAAMVVLDSELPLDDPITIERRDLDELKRSGSRLRLGTTLPRREMLQLALMASENRAAAALARTYPGGTPSFVEAMNQKAKQLGMFDTRYVDATGLNPRNVSTALDLAVLVNAGYNYPLIRDYSTAASMTLPFQRRRDRQALTFRNSNGLVRGGGWEIDLQKTGYIKQAGRCLVMQTRIADTPVIVVLLDSRGRRARIADANRIKRWIEGLSSHGNPLSRHDLNAPSSYLLSEVPDRN